MGEWTLVKATDIIDFNPRESLPRNTMAKKVAMEQLQPLTRDIPYYEMALFSGGTKFRNGDTLMARITPCLENGKIARVNLLEDGEVGFGSTEFIVLRAKPDISDSDYVYYLATSQILRDIAIKSMVGSSGRQRVQQGVLSNTYFLAPLYAEQVEIGRTLRALDDKVENNNRICKTLEEMALVIYHNFLSRKTGERRSVTDVATINQDTYSEKENWEFVHYLDTSSITNGRIDAIQHIDLANEKLPSRARRKVTRNDIVYSTVRPTQRHFGLISDPVENMLVSTGFAVIRSKCPFVSNEYIYTLLRSSSVVEKLQRLAEQSVSTFPSIRPSDIGACEIIVPSFEEGKRINSLLVPLYGMIALLNKESMHLATLRDTLLPKLMSGEIAVPVAEVK